MGKTFEALSRYNYTQELQPNQRYRHDFNDKRLMVKHEEMYESMLKEQSVIINQVSQTNRERTSFYRFMSNSKVSGQELLEKHCEIDTQLIKGSHILCIGDTTSISLKGRVEKIKDKQEIGVLEDNKTPGMFSHANIAVSGESSQVLGLTDLTIWNRARRSKAEEKEVLSYKQKESYKWELGALNSETSLTGASQITYIFDREADNYETMARILQNPTREMVIRSNYDRSVIFEGQPLRMSEGLNQQPWQAEIEIDIRPLNHYSSTHGKQIQRKARRALVRLRWICVQIRPSSFYKGNVPIERPLYILEIKEDDTTVPDGEDPIHWRILTSHKISNKEQALQVVDYYQQRWFIEQLFRILKKQGLDIEATQLESKDAIIRQWILAFGVACTVLQLTLARDQTEGHTIAAAFDKKDQIVLKHLCQKLEGKTTKLQNPFPIDQLSWATWIIARLGGWKGYKSQRPPGPITILRGLKKFTQYRKAADLFLFSQIPPPAASGSG